MSLQVLTHFLIKIPSKKLKLFLCNVHHPKAPRHKDTPCASEGYEDTPLTVNQGIKSQPAPTAPEHKIHRIIIIRQPRKS